MKKFRLINQSTKDEVVIEAENLSIACAQLGWIPSMTQPEVVSEEE